MCLGKARWLAGLIHTVLYLCMLRWSKAPYMLRCEKFRHASYHRVSLVHSGSDPISMSISPISNTPTGHTVATVPSLHTTPQSTLRAPLVPGTPERSQSLRGEPGATI